MTENKNCRRDGEKNFRHDGNFRHDAEKHFRHDVQAHQGECLLSTLHKILRPRLEAKNLGFFGRCNRTKKFFGRRNGTKMFLAAVTRQKYFGRHNGTKIFAPLKNFAPG